MASHPIAVSIFKGASLALLARVVFTVASFAVTSITALWYGAGMVGVVATITTMATFLGIIANAGTSTSVNTFVAAPLSDGATAAARGAYRQIVAICLSGSLGLGALIVLLGGIWTLPILDGIDGVSVLSLTALAAVAVPMRVLAEITSLVMRTLDHVAGFAMLVALPALVNLGFLGLGVSLGAGPGVAAWAYVAGLGTAAVTGFIWIRRRFDTLPSSPAVADVPAIPEILGHSFPMLLSTLGAYVVSGSGVLLMSYFASDAETGVFSVALRLATITSFVLMSINAITTPMFARLHAQGRTDELVSVARRTSKLMFWAVAPIIAGLLVFGRPILGLAFGPQFEAAYAPMLVVLAGQLVNTVTGPSDFLMNMTGMQRQLRNIVGPAAAIALVLGVALVPAWGATGAALAYGISLTLWNLAAAVVLSRRFGSWIGYLPFLSVR